MKTDLLPVLRWLVDGVAHMDDDEQAYLKNEMAAARAAIAEAESAANVSEDEMEFRAKFRTSALEAEADKLQLAVILYARRPHEPFLAALDAAILQKIGRAISVLAVKQCNLGLTDSDEKRWSKLAEQASTIAGWYDLTATCHGDPRGYVLRLHGEGLERNGWGDGFGVA